METKCLQPSALNPNPGIQNLKSWNPKTLNPRIKTLNLGSLKP